MNLQGKKLLFLGGELGKFREWSESRELDWSVLDYDSHKGLQNYVKTLNHLYKEHPCLYENEKNWDGFKWISVDDKDHNVLAYERISSNGEKMIAIMNFSFCDWYDYNILNVDDGNYKVIVCSSDKKYGGYTEYEGYVVKSENNSFRLNLPYSSGIILIKEKENV